MEVRIQMKRCADTFLIRIGNSAAKFLAVVIFLCFLYDSRDGTATSAGIGRRISDGARGGGRLVPSRFQSVVTALAIAQQHIKTAARLQEDF